MTPQYAQFLERSITTAKSLAAHLTETARHTRELLAKEFLHPRGPTWGLGYATEKTVFTHIEYEACAKAHNDVVRLYTALLEDKLSYESALSDLEAAVHNAQERLAIDLNVIADVLVRGNVPSDQVGWIAHRARIEVLEESLENLKANPPQDYA